MDPNLIATVSMAVAAWAMGWVSYVHGRRADLAEVGECRHEYEVVVESCVTGERLGSWCPVCESRFYSARYLQGAA